jgi:hypothetical protein
MKIRKADVEATGKPRYTNWSHVPEGLKTKTQWSQDGMRLRAEAEPAGYVWSRHRSTHFALYDGASVEPKRKPSPGEARPLTSENIGAALFEINKAAKRRRDAASTAYQKRRHEAARVQKDAKRRLYDFKSRVLRKAKADGLAQLVGYHVKHGRVSRRVWQEPVFDDDPVEQGEEEFYDLDDWENDDSQPSVDGGWTKVDVDQTTWMACYELGGFRFHKILDEPPEGAKREVKDLGEWLSTATPRTRHMTLKDAEATLNAYLRSQETRG